MIRSKPLVFLPVLPFKKGSIEAEAMMAWMKRSYNGNWRMERVVAVVEAQPERIS